MFKGGQEREVFPASYDLSREPFKRRPIRPLGEVSTFVVEQLPEVLRAVRDGENEVSVLSAHAESLLAVIGGTKLDKILGDGDNGKIAAIDVLYLRQGIMAHGGKIGPKLQQAIDKVSGKKVDERTGRISYDRPPVITYADLIFTNPIRKDPRTFMSLDTQVGREELDFYETHLQIEERLEAINDAAFGAIDILNRKGQNAVEEAVRELRKAGFLDAQTRRAHGDNYPTSFIVNNMKRVGKLREEGPEGMTRDLFRVFRNYYPSYVDNTGLPWYQQIRGASGKFSAGFPLFELLLAGDTLPRKRMNEDAIFGYQYYSDHERERIGRAMALAANGQTLDALSEKLGDPEELFQTLRQMDNFLLRFRGEHSSGVKNQLPEVYEGKAAGTGGEGDVPSFFRERMMRDIVRPRRSASEILGDGTSMYL